MPQSDRPSLVQITGPSTSTCGYCHAATAGSTSYGIWAYDITAKAYQDLIDRGWRRSGQYMYKPVMTSTCCPAYTIRLGAVSGFVCSKGQKKVVRKMRRFVREGRGSSSGSNKASADGHADMDDGYDTGAGTFGNDNDVIGGDTEQFVAPSEPMPMKVDPPLTLISDLDRYTDTHHNHAITAQPQSVSHQKDAPIADTFESTVALSGETPTLQPIQQQQQPPTTETATTVSASTACAAESSDRPTTTTPHQTSTRFYRTEKKPKNKKMNKMNHVGPGVGTEPGISADTVSGSMSAFELLIHQALFPDKPRKHQIKVVIEPSGFTQEVFDLYCKYQIAIHHDAPSRLSHDQFIQFLVDSPIRFESPTTAASSVNHNDHDDGDDDKFPGFGSFHQKYYVDGQLIAVAVIDILPRCVSSVYFMYDPAYRFLSLGTFSALLEISLTMRLSRHVPGLDYYYMGFYIHSCVKMRYKAQYRPSDLLCPETYEWVPLQSVVGLLDIQPATVLVGSHDAMGVAVPAREPRAIQSIQADHVGDDVVGNTIVMYQRQLYRLGNVMHRRRLVQSVKELYTLVGPDLLSRLVLVVTRWT